MVKGQKKPAIKKARKKESVSQLLRKIVSAHKKEKSISYGELIQSMGERAFGLITILFALPSGLPISIIPGFSFVFGLPIVFIALHLIIGRKSLWLPARLARQTVDIDTLEKVLSRTRPYLLYIERLLKPRLLFCFSGIAEHIHGLCLLLLSLLLLLPIPLSNFVFAALIICFGLGLIEKDGLLILLAYLGFAAYILFLNQVIRQLLGLFA
ncbi:exopolysaccharide biosynthesis protein [Legionella sp. 16cNR16C]|uniref:exopolysaccharide biosynthesis protein n=1 Tax=Legionella sp. 16cNR16C TaxID=2905656 RepID=UPI001E5D1564|nr:exopolysaccharide biosynthesis protein [Legionella sp. 16cNR16C]MCE3046374.1 exopolysaccharide biosynthesis protein [Legionella sp. 16cNR16C]